MRAVLALIFLLRLTLSAAAEDILTQSRHLATTGHRGEALALLYARLAEKPSDVDCRTLYGLILSWEGRYNEAREALDQVLTSSPGYYDALLGLIRVELWAGRPARAEQ